jgi:hypothetical protein
MEFFELTMFYFLYTSMKEWKWFSQSHVFSKILNWLNQSDARISQFGAGYVEWQSGLLHT